MKRRFIVITMLLLGFVLVACGETTTEATTTEAVTTEATTEAPTTTVEVVELAELYEGSHTVSAMGSDVVYLYILQFVDGTYTFHSEFEMGGEVYTFDETGTYSLEGSVITATPDGGEAATGTVNEDGSIEFPVKASSMGSRAAQTLTEVVLDRYYIGTHTVSAMGSDVVYVYTYTFAFGVYVFHSDFEMGGSAYSYDEFGTYTVDGDSITITPVGEDAVTGTINEDGTITIGIKASSMASRADHDVEPTALAHKYAGTHTVSAMGSDVVYNYTIVFEYGTYTFHSSFEMGGTVYTYDETGTYSVEGTVITATPDGDVAAAGAILFDGSIEFPVKASSMGSRATQTLIAISEVVLD